MARFSIRFLLLLAVGAMAGVLMIAADSAAGISTAGSAIEIDGVGFTIAEVQRKNPGALFQAQNALFEAERKAAEEFIDDYLVKREAEKDKLTVDELLERDVYSKLEKNPSEEALRFYYDGIDTPESFGAVRDKISEHIRQRRMAKAKASYIKQLRAKAEVVMRMPAPRADIETKNAPIRGAAPAAVTVVEFADYECPYCQQIQPVVKRLEQEYKGKIAFAFKDVPLPMHAHAQKAAEAAHCAAEQGKFWEYHDLLFDSKQYNLTQLKDHARALKLDAVSFDKCLDSGAQADRIRADVAEATAVGLPGTPGFFVNGRFLNGAVDYQTLKDVIDEELRAGSAAMSETARANKR